MDSCILGLLKLRLKRGINLAIRDARATSDPYVIVNVAEQKLKTRVMKNNCNPEWDEELTLSIKDVNTPIHLTVYDKDTFTVDDKMGEADIDLKPYLQCFQVGLNNLPNGSIVKRIQPNRTNCLAEESICVWQNGNIIQEMILRLRNVERGELVAEIEWIDVLGCKGLSGIEI
ncbi:protein C2-DOMAIN ABA-RELATED 9-like [Abrus precatorius]|uniref:Protein C2-DOMAIN ABA-RELATED 9-like n=1 Tax=Abrus precatorius TaxID=3816 RepID=A0A8B8M3X3_ABRPR|nr:protein C2-DOMAIN ABA-RELATED 9-like [Abrus precatorius]